MRGLMATVLTSSAVSTPAQQPTVLRDVIVTQARRRPARPDIAHTILKMEQDANAIVRPRQMMRFAAGEEPVKKCNV